MNDKVFVMLTILFVSLTACQAGKLPEGPDSNASWQVTFNESGVYDGVTGSGDGLRLATVENGGDAIRHTETARLFDGGRGLSGLVFNDNGTEMYVSDWDLAIHAFSLSQPWNLTSVEKGGEAQNVDHRVEDLFFKNNGSDMYTVSSDYPDTEYTGNQLIKWNTSPSYNVEQATREEREALTEPDYPHSMYLADDEAVFIADQTAVHQYTMRDGDVTSLDYQANRSINTDSSVADIWFDGDGETMFVLIGYHSDTSQKKIRAYSLEEPWEVTTAQRSYEHTIPRPRSEHRMAFAFDPGQDTVSTVGLDDTVYSYEYNPVKEYVTPGTYVSDWYDWNQTVNVTAVTANTSLSGGAAEITVEASTDGDTTSGGQQVALTHGEQTKSLTAVTGRYTRVRVHLDSDGYSTPTVNNVSLVGTR